MIRTHVSFTQKMVAASLLTALTAVCAQIQIPLPVIPINLALLGVYLCGALLGARWGALSMAAYVLMGAVGMPVFAGFLSGPSVLFGPTGGYLFGYILCAAVVGALSRRLRFSTTSLCLSMALGTAVCYAAGTLWFVLTSGSGLWAVLTTCVLPFLPGDALKIVLASALVLRTRKTFAQIGMID